MPKARTVRPGLQKRPMRALVKALRATDNIVRPQQAPTQAASLAGYSLSDMSRIEAAQDKRERRRVKRLREPTSTR
jgi:hypothetical protein